MIDVTIVSLVVGFGLIALAWLHSKRPALRGIYTFFAGILWVFSGVTIYPDYDAGWVIISIGLGILLIVEGALEMSEVM